MRRYATGACDRLLSPESISFRSAFFTPYCSGGDALVEAASIVVTPVIYSSLLIFEVLKLGTVLFDDITSTPTNKQDDDKFNYKECLKLIGVLILITPFSPFINLAGFIGCSIASLFSDEQKTFYAIEHDPEEIEVRSMLTSDADQEFDDLADPELDDLEEPMLRRRHLI